MFQNLEVVERPSAAIANEIMGRCLGNLLLWVRSGSGKLMVLAFHNLEFLEHTITGSPMKSRARRGEKPLFMGTPRLAFLPFHKS